MFCNLSADYITETAIMGITGDIAKDCTPLTWLLLCLAVRHW